MKPTYDDVFDEWKSLYTEEIRQIWNTERKELRVVAMVFHVLKQEFARIETNLNDEMDSFREKVVLIDSLRKSNTVPRSPESTPNKPLQINNSEDSQLSKSPKLNKYRKNSHSKKPKSSSFLFNIQNENSTKNILQMPTIQQKHKSEELFSSSFDSPLNRNGAEDSIVDNKSDHFKTPQGVKRPANADIVDSSLIVEETPDKIKWTRKKSLKGNKSARNKENSKSSILKKMLSLPNQNIKVNTSDFKNKNAKPSTIVKDKPGEPSLDDHTFCALAEENHKDVILNKNMEHRKNIPVPDKFIKNYDKLPVPKSKSPQHVHKTETVRRKADRMKLPGWSCTDCETYYEGLDLSPEELRKKMNACSKHRNKFELLDTTPKGFWDVAMPPTQDEDKTLFNF